MPDLQEIVPGVHRWVAEHPEWNASQGGAEGWSRDVACVAYEGDGALVLIDPLVPDGDWRSLDALVEGSGSRLAIVVTCNWHRRNAGEALARYVNLAEKVTTHAHSTAAKRLDFDVMQEIEGRAELPGGVEVIETDPPQGEITLWLERARTVIAGDVLLGAEGERTEALRVCPEGWLDAKNTVENVKSSLRPLLERDIRAIVPLHGTPVTKGTHEALERALA